RSGSTTSCSSTFRMSGAKEESSGRSEGIFTTRLYFAMCLRYLKDVAVGLGDANFLEARPLAGKKARPVRLEALENLTSQILRRRNHVLECRLLIQVLVVERLGYLVLHEPVEHPNIHGAPGALFDACARTDLDFIVV